MDQQQALLQRRAHVVGKFNRRGTGAAFCAIHHNKVGGDAGGHHGLHHGKPLPGVAKTELEAGGFAARQRAQLFYEKHQLDGRGERAMRCGRNAVHAYLDTACCGNLGRDLGAWQYAAMAGLGALAQLELNHFDLRVQRVGGKFVGIEGAVGIAATKVARGHFPDQVATMHTVVLRDGTLARVVGKAAPLGPRVQRQNGVGAERAKTHGRDVEDTCVVRLRTARSDRDPKIVRCHFGGGHGMVHPLIAFGMHIELRAKRPLVGVAFGALVHQRALRP